MTPTSEKGASGSCLGDEVMAGFLEASLSDGARDAATLHLSTCQSCREQFAELARLEADEPESYQSLVFDEGGDALHGGGEDADELVVGSSLGRYVLLGKVGEGGMGVVYSAFDPELDRRIAVKVIRSEAAATSEEAKRQLRQEARAMARLTHPNVVRVYDVGRQGGLVYIAMEYVDGMDLGRFAARHKDDWRKVFSACLQAGRGLLAAHDAELVHRDFKPSNVLCANDGRVLVADFGLTRLLRPGFREGDGAETRAAGTPGYVAPEQAKGLASTAKSDQYSYCVTLSQCLLGRDPNAQAASEASTVSSLKSSELAEQNSQEQNGAIAPRRLRAVLQKGMAFRIEDRHDSMQTLLGRLQRVVHRRKRTRIILASVAGAASIGVLMFVLGKRATEQEPICSNSHSPVTAVWNDARQSKLTNALLGSPYKEHAKHFRASLARAANALASEHTKACEATFIGHTQSAELYDRQVLCLGSQVTALDAIVSAAEDGESIESAQSVFAKLGAPEDCVPSESMLNAQAPPRDAELRSKMQEVDATLAEATLFANKDQGARVVKTTGRAVALAKTIGYDPILAKALLSHSEVLALLERFAEAREVAEAARDAASRGRDNVLLIQSLLLLADHVTTNEDRAIEGLAYVDTARSIALGTTLAPYYRALLNRSAAIVARANGRGEESLSEAHEGLERIAKSEGETPSPRDLELRESLISLVASADFDASNFDAALSGFTEIVALKTQRLGPRHSGIASALANLATIQYKLGKIDDALITLTDARDRLQSPDASKSTLARCLNLQGLILGRLEHDEEAAAIYREAIAVQTEVYGEDHRMVWSTKNNLANVLVELEQWQEAIALQEAQRSWAIKSAGNESDLAIRAAINLANTLSIGGQGEADFTRATDLIDEVLPLMKADDRRLINVYSVQGKTNFRLAKNRESALAYTKALAQADTTENVRESLVAYLYARRGESYWSDGDKKRALVDARRAVAMYRTMPEKASILEELEGWISEREPRRERGD
tara:strand:+ start:11496 stop:14534 length:3039 start_codon:yes stop_codon:yes gene_type:complete